MFAGIEIDEMIEATTYTPSAEELRRRATQFIIDNQECYVAQWILQNPFANVDDYELKFTYNENSQFGYSVSMEKKNVQ